MARRKKIYRKNLSVDPIYKSQLISHLINRVMISGKKTIAQAQVYQTMDELKKKTDKNPLEVFNKALDNIKPMMEVRPRRVGGAAYQIPMSVRGERRESLAIRWLINSAKKRSNKEFHNFWQKLAAEIIDASNNQGGAIKKRDEIHRMAEANKAFAHFRW